MKLGSACVLLCLVVGGCAPKRPVVTWQPMGAEAPAFGSSPALQSWAGFLPGRWGLTEMSGSGLGKSGNWRDVAKPDEDNVGDSFEFAADGTFTLSYGPYPITGRWRDQGQTVVLEFLTLNGKPLQTAISEIRAKASSGRQGAIADDIFVDRVTEALPKMNSLRLAEDSKSLTFAPADAGANPMDSFAIGSRPTLQRLAKQEKKS